MGAAALLDHWPADGRTAGARQLGAAFVALAAKTWRHPVSGRDVRFGVFHAIPDTVPL